MSVRRAMAYRADNRSRHRHWPRQVVVLRDQVRIRANAVVSGRSDGIIRMVAAKGGSRGCTKSGGRICATRVDYA